MEGRKEFVNTRIITAEFTFIERGESNLPTDEEWKQAFRKAMKRVLRRSCSDVVVTNVQSFSMLENVGEEHTNAGEHDKN